MKIRFSGLALFAIIFGGFIEAFGSCCLLFVCGIVVGDPDHILKDGGTRPLFMFIGLLFIFIGIWLQYSMVRKWVIDGSIEVDKADLGNKRVKDDCLILFQEFLKEKFPQSKSEEF